MRTLMTLGTHTGLMLPPIELPSTAGPFRSAAYRGKRPLVMLVGAAGNAREFELAAARLALCHEAFEQAGAAVVGVLPGDEQTARELAVRQRLPFPIAWDERGAMIERLADSLETAQPGLALYVTDRFLEIHLCVIARAAADLPNADRLVALVEGIERECPECGAADEGWRAA